MESEYAISLRNVCKSYPLYDRPEDRLKQFLWRGRRRFYRDFAALSDISFDMPKGQTIGIIGRNGAGKSTLLQIIAGTLTPTSGSVEVRGRVAALLELGSGFSPEFTGRENVLLNAAVLGLTPDEISERFDDIVRFSQIGDFLEQPVKTYSSGMQMRLAFSVAVCIQPEILIVDEALSVGDMAFQFKCVQRLEQMARDGVTILFVSHSLGIVRSMCDQAIYLRNGQISQQGDTSDVIERYLMDLREDQRKDAGSPYALKPKNYVKKDGGHAFGTDQGHIKAATFGNLSDCLAVQHGDEVTIQVAVEFDGTVANPEVAMIIQDRRTVAVTGGCVALTPKRANEDKAQRTVEFRFQAMQTPGRWFITLVLREKLGDGLKVPIDKQVAALALDVSGEADIEYIGLADIGVRGAEVDVLADSIGSTRPVAEN